MILPPTQGQPQTPIGGLFHIFPNQDVNFGQSLARAPQSLIHQPLPIVLNQLQEKQQMLMRHMQQQQQQYMLDQQSVVQSQLRALLNQLKKNDQFNSLPVHEQQEILIQHFAQNQQFLQQRNVPQQPQNTIPQPPVVQAQASNPQQTRSNQQATSTSVVPPPNQPQPTQSIAPTHLSGGNNNELVDNSQLMNSANNPLNISPMIKQILANKTAPSSNIWGLNGEPLTVTAIEEMQRQERKNP